MSDQHAVSISWSARMIWAFRNFFVTTVAIAVWLLASFVALSLILVFTAMWYVFFGAPVFGDFFGFMGSRGPATPPTTWTLVFVGAMFLVAAIACYLIIREWNEWRRRILQTRRKWRGLA
jgi:hypothetical protein